MGTAALNNEAGLALTRTHTEYRPNRCHRSHPSATATGLCNDNTNLYRGLSIKPCLESTAPTSAIRWPVFTGPCRPERVKPAIDAVRHLRLLCLRYQTIAVYSMKVSRLISRGVRGCRWHKYRECHLMGLLFGKFPRPRRTCEEWARKDNDMKYRKGEAKEAARQVLKGVWTAMPYSWDTADAFDEAANAPTWST